MAGTNKCITIASSRKYFPFLVLWFTLRYLKTIHYKYSAVAGVKRTCQKLELRQKKQLEKLILAIQKVWQDQAGTNEAEESEDMMGKAHELLQACKAKKIREVLGPSSVEQFLGEIWLQKHPSVKQYSKALGEAIREKA